MAELIYLYGIITDQEAATTPLPSMKGFDGEHDLETMKTDGLYAVISRLGSGLTEEVIKEKTNNDMDWLQEKAFHHHETLLTLQKLYTIIPMKFCTIYANEHNLINKIKIHVTDLKESLHLLKGNEEWNLKIYCDETILKKEWIPHNSKIDAREKEISQLPPGRQFFERRKLDKLIETELANEKNAICERLHTALKVHAIKETVKKNWSRDVTGRQEEMSWNSVYLLPSDHVKTFLNKIEEANEKMKDLGFQLETSGPWPPYHFATLTGNGDY